MPGAGVAAGLFSRRCGGHRIVLAPARWGGRRVFLAPAAVVVAVRERHPVQFFGVPRVWEKLAAAVKAVIA
ncbi:hypothetical protein, partial [Streptomyces sp. NPDC058678]|uniref:hypothetical protein n=1 Tax=Streptomyces sp. NPDC058678 TaxID=3346595 RepID=UPI0036464EA9